MRAFTLALIAVLHLTLALIVWRAKPKSHVNLFFALHTLTFAGWTFGIAWIQTGMWAQAGSNLTFASASLIPPTLLMFTIHYPDAKQTSWGIPQCLALFVGAVFALISLTTEWLAYDVHWDRMGISRRPGILYPSFTVYFITVLSAALAVFVRKWRSARERERTQLNYYGTGLLIAAIGGICANLIVPATTGNSSVSHLGPYFGLVLTALTAHATVRHRFMDLRVVIHRSLTIAIGVLFSLVPVLILVLLIRRSMLMHLTLLETLLTGGAFLAIALLIPLTGDVAERLIDRYVYRARANPQRLLRQASTELTRALDLGRLLTVISDTIHATAEPEGVAIYLEHDGSLRLSVARVVDSNEAFTAPPEPAAPVISEAIARAAPLLRDELDTPADSAPRTALNAAGWALVLPLFADHRIVGLIAVGSKRSGDPFFSEDVDALATLANHAGSALRNAGLYAQVVLANEYVNQIVAAMQNGVVAVDASGAITLVNPAAHDLLGLGPEALRKVDDLPAPLRIVMEEVLSHSCDNVAHEITLPEAELPPRPLLCTASRLHDHSSNCAGAVVVFSDLTPLKELDKQRARAENLASLQRMTQAVAHEIGNPLVPIKTLTKLLPERFGDRAFADNVSRIVSREIERIERLVARLRRIAPTAELSHSLVDLRTPMRHALEVVEAAAADQNTRLDGILPPQPVLVMGDSAEIEELFLNLITNALEAVVDQPAGLRCIQVSVSVDDRGAIAEIRDTGQGIAADLVDRIFDPFVTTKSRGSGLGLAICSGIVERHHGQLGAANADSGGAVFTMILPRAEDDRRDGVMAKQEDL